MADGMTWVWLDDEERALRLANEFVARGSVNLPELPLRTVLGKADVPLAPPSHRHYVKAWPERWKKIVAEDVMLKAGSPTSGLGATVVRTTQALVFERR